MRCNLVSLVLTIAVVESGVSAQVASNAQAHALAPILSAKPRVAPSSVPASIQEVAFLGEDGGDAQYLVSGHMAPNSTAMLAVQIVGDGYAAILIETKVRSNSAGEFSGVVSVPDEGRLVAIMLLSTSGAVLAVWK